MTLPEMLMHDGQRKRAVRWDASWSLNLRVVPHTLWILWEGETKFQRFTSDETGAFPMLENVPEAEGFAACGWKRRPRGGDAE